MKLGGKRNAGRATRDAGKAIGENFVQSSKEDSARFLAVIEPLRSPALSAAAGVKLVLLAESSVFKRAREVGFPARYRLGGAAGKKSG
jgi:hypothetical protein